MALTKVTTGVVKDVVNSSSTITVRSIDSIGIITASSFVGSGASFSSVVTATSFVGDGSGLTGVATNYYKAEVFAYDNILSNDISVTTAYKTAAIYADRDLTVDIENGVTVTVDDGCYLNIVDI
jgi:hypothetical protein